MRFALLLGAANIIFPPSAGMAAGEHVWVAAVGFLLMGVGLQLLTLVALARVGGGLQRLTAPPGRHVSSVFAVVSFEMGVAPFSGNNPTALGLYTLVYFACVLFLSLNPGQLVERIGKWIAPLLLSALLVLGSAALFAPAGAIGALVFGIVMPPCYRTVVSLLGVFSLLVANQGLNQLISVSVPVLVALYPLAIVLVLLSLADRLWCQAPRVFLPVMAVPLLFGLMDGLNAASLSGWVPSVFSPMPLTAESLGRLLSVRLTLLLAAGFARLRGPEVLQAD
jgi:branched-subunit amino acid permease